VLAGAYNQAMKRVNGQKPGFKELAMKVLLWITCAKRLLTTSELQHAVAIKFSKSKLDQGDLPQIGDMVSVCAGLVDIDKKSNIIRLVHYTAQEYFEQKQKELFPKAGTQITKACITYLSFDTFEFGFCPTDEEFEARLQLYPLYDYIARNWGHHARTASTEVEKLILGLLESETKKSAASQALFAPRKGSLGSHYSQIVPRQMTGVHLAAYFGLTGVIMALLENRHNADVKDTYGRTPLWWAAENGHEAMAKLLLEKGAELESKDGYDGRTLLSWAAGKGHEAVVKLLLEEGAELESKDGYDGRTPLWWAAEKGHEAVVKLLLEKGAGPESKDNDRGWTLLSRAAEKGHEAVVKLLLEKGAEPESKDRYDGRTPLSWAAEKGHEAVVKLLLEKGAEPEPKDGYNGRTPLWWAAEKGHEAVVKLLLEKGAEPESKDIHGRTPLSRAAEKGHEAVVKLLTSIT
jgi:ankyrin repeat protein